MIGVSKRSYILKAFCPPKVISFKDFLFWQHLYNSFDLYRSIEMKTFSFLKLYLLLKNQKNVFIYYKNRKAMEPIAFS